VYFNSRQNWTQISILDINQNKINRDTSNDEQILNSILSRIEIQHLC